MKKNDAFIVKKDIPTLSVYPDIPKGIMCYFTGNFYGNYKNKSVYLFQFYGMAGKLHNGNIECYSKDKNCYWLSEKQIKKHLEYIKIIKKINTINENQVTKNPYQSQNDIILAHFQDGRSITTWEAITKYRITRLSRVIYDLRKKGYKINSENIHDLTSGKKYTRYWMDIK
ncbi:MAG: helix-turn-helix domain-containing protein [Candidatus Paceibacterota bacterium]